jgi:hypothetical protein
MECNSGGNKVISDYIGYCGIYCENCAVKARVAPAAKVLFEEMRRAGFEEFIAFMPDGDTFWAFLKGMAEDGTCTSCKDGSGNPGCAVRICARGKGVEICALCEEYPCKEFDAFFEGYPVLRDDNALLREQGIGAWAKLQDERRTKGDT